MYSPHFVELYSLFKACNRNVNIEGSQFTFMVSEPGWLLWRSRPLSAKNTQIMFANCGRPFTVWNRLHELRCLLDIFGAFESFWSFEKSSPKNLKSESIHGRSVNWYPLKMSIGTPFIRELNDDLKKLQFCPEVPEIA